MSRPRPLTTWRAPHLDLARGLYIPCVVTWNEDTGEFTRTKGPQGFLTWQDADEAARFLEGGDTL